MIGPTYFTEANDRIGHQSSDDEEEEEFELFERA